MATNREEELRLGEFIKFLAPRLGRTLWPPDIFAICASLLLRSGSYPTVVSRWPPSIRRAKTKARRRAIAQKWTEQTQLDGLEWRIASSKRRSPPPRVLTYWRRVVSAARLRISDIPQRPPLVAALLTLLAMADEACAGVGLGPGVVETESPDYDAFDFISHRLLFEKGTLCRDVDATRLRVFPKLHTPQSGITIRSLSHHLACCTTTEVKPQWFRLAQREGGNRLHVVVVPYPYTLKRSQFQPTSGKLHNMPPEFGFFTFTPNERARTGFVSSLVDEAHQQTGQPVDLVILPELALTEAQHRRMCEEITAKRRVALIAGVAIPATTKRPASNHFLMSVPVAGGMVVFPKQHKHHRWKLNESQIQRYGLGKALRSRKYWWEYVSIGERQLLFLSIHPAVVMSVLICEDLARQEPISDVMRAVGPDLVIALLMDGPQLKGRWSDRYATVLADDPGSSVLTLTSRGMVNLDGWQGNGQSASVGLWRDAQSGKSTELELKPPNRAISLLLRLDQHEEWTADGRSDGGASVYPTLERVARLR
jgi:hypothetical protein